MPSYAVTGASRGLGFEFVNQISTNPTNVVVGIVRDPATAEKLQELSKTRSNVHIVQADVSNAEAVIAAASAVSKITGGSLDILIHNAMNMGRESAGIAPTGFTPDKADDVYTMFQDCFSTGIFGTMWLTNAFLPLIEKGQEKKIVFITSGMADADVTLKAGVAYAVPYSVAKAGMNMLATKFAIELSSKNIKVLALSPGWVRTAEGPGEFLRS
jgi:NAD(P)-dependent dehydrogenase (short-subunit alcohol dehydrogenase family)